MTNFAKCPLNYPWTSLYAIIFSTPTPSSPLSIVFANCSALSYCQDDIIYIERNLASFIVYVLPLPVVVSFHLTLILQLSFFYFFLSELLLMLYFSPSFCLLMCFVPGSQWECVTAAAFPVQVDSDWFPAANWSDWFKGSQSSPVALQDATSLSCHCKQHRLKAPEEAWAHQGTVHQVQSNSWMMQKCTYIFNSCIAKTLTNIDNN